MTDFREIIKELNNYPDGCFVPTLGRRSKFHITYAQNDSEDVIKITNSGNTSILVNKIFWDKVVLRMNNIEAVDRNRAAMYTITNWPHPENPSTLFSPCIPAIIIFMDYETTNKLNQRDLFIKKYNFEKIGTYTSGSTGIVDRISETHIRISERKSLVYALFVGEACKYIGKTIQGYSRPLSYHKNEIMKSVKSGIENTIKNKNTVEVYAKTDNLNVDFIDLNLNIVEAIEQALITKYDPEWNNFRQK